MGWRNAADDFGRIWQVGGAVVALVVAVWAGTSWSWWASLYEVPLPIRAAGVLGVASCAFVIPCVVALVTHRYFGWPKLNPFTGLEAPTSRMRLRVTESIEDDLFRIRVRNDGPTGTFAVQVTAAHGAQGLRLPVSLAWSDTKAEAREIPLGHTHFVDVLRATFNKRDESPRFTIDTLWLQTSSGEKPWSPQRWIEPSHIPEPSTVEFAITSTQTGERLGYALTVYVLANPSSDPSNHMLVFRHCVLRSLGPMIA